MVARTVWAVLGVLAFAQGVIAQGTFIPTTTRRDHVFDATGSVLYFTTSDGNLRQYSVATATMLPQLPVGVSLNAIDITPDGTTAFITDRTTSATQAFVRRLNLTTGAVTTLAYGLGFQESHSWDLVMVSNDRGFVTANLSGLGWTWVRQINIATNSIIARPEVGLVPQRAMLDRAADRSQMLLVQGNVSSGPLWRYTTSTNAFTFGLDTDWFLGGAITAVSRNGALFAVPLQVTTIYNAQFQVVATLPSSAGLIFDPVRDLLYVADPISDQIVAYRTTDWGVESVFPVGENMFEATRFGQGVMSISDNGERLALSTFTGIRIYNIPAPGAMGLLVVAGFGAGTRRRR